MQLKTRPSSNVPDQRRLEQALENARWLHTELEDLSRALVSRITATMTDAADDELGYHALWVDQMQRLLEESSARIEEVKRYSNKRLFFIVVSKDSVGIVTYGKNIWVDGDMVPTLPKSGTDEYAVMVKWFVDNRGFNPAREKLDWKLVRDVCNELAEKGEPMPPGIKLYSKEKIRITDHK